MKTWLKWILGIIFVVFILPVIITMAAFFMTSCFNMSCFDEKASDCKYVGVTVEEEFGEVHYLAKKNYDTGRCFFEKTIVTLNEDTELNDLLENKSYTCWYDEGDYNPEWSSTMFGGLDTCQGELKDAMGQLVLFV